MTEKEPVTIRIHPESRYVLLIDGFVFHDEIVAFQKGLDIWWKSNDKFLVIGARDGIEVRLERVDEV